MNIAFLLTLHFIAGFVMQNDYIATNKSKNPVLLTVHASEYGAMVAGAYWIWMFQFDWTQIIYLPVMMAWLACTHWAIDWCTSRICAYYFQREKRHNFFVTIWAGQLLHAYVLIAMLSPAWEYIL